MTDLEQRLSKLQKQFHGIKIMGGEGAIVHGSPTRGFVVEVKAGTVGSGAGGGGGEVLGCTDPAADNYNPSATVEDGSCEYTYGACCIDADCSITTEVGCEGVYQGDDTTCDPNPCVCPEVTLNCDQVCLLERKCGWEGFFNSGISTDTYWRTAEAGTHTMFDHTGDPGNVVCDMFADSTVRGNFPFTPTGGFCDPSDATEIACSGGGTCTCDDGTTTCYWCPSFCAPDDCTGSVIVNPAYTFRVGTPLSDTEVTFSPGETIFPDVSGFTILSEEITTSDLIADIVANLPDYDDSYTDSCEAKLIDEFEDNSRYTICRFKPKFTFTAAPVDFNINYNEHFEPSDMSGPTDTPRSVFVSTGETEVFGDEVMEPVDKGIITITDISTDCVLV